MAMAIGLCGWAKDQVQGASAIMTTTNKVEAKKIYVISKVKRYMDYHSISPERRMELDLFWNLALNKKIKILIT